MTRILAVTFAALLAGCAASGPSGPRPGDSRISCPATCQTTYTQCSGGCASARRRTPSECIVTCDRVLEECLRSCELPPAGQ
jgi:hypothetical protein